jgi:hypothetical protein
MATQDSVQLLTEVQWQWELQAHLPDMWLLECYVDPQLSHCPIYQQVTSEGRIPVLLWAKYC